MNIITTTALIDHTGETMSDGGGDVTLRRVVQVALTANLEDDNKLTPEEKVKLFNLASDVRADEVEWTPEDVALVRARIGKAYGVAVVGAAFALLG